MEDNEGSFGGEQFFPLQRPTYGCVCFPPCHTERTHDGLLLGGGDLSARVNRRICISAPHEACVVVRAMRALMLGSCAACVGWSGGPGGDGCPPHRDARRADVGVVEQDETRCLPHLLVRRAMRAELT